MENHQVTYAGLLKRYCNGDEPDVLREGAVLGEELISAGIGPMDIKTIHDMAVAEVVDPESTQGVTSAHRLLLEVLLSYGAAYSARAERLLAEADVTQQATAEGAARAEQARLELLAGVSHELGNPLTIVKVNVASIRRFLEERGGWHEDLDQRQADVTFAVERMMALREELLAASRDERRELEVMPTPITHGLARAVRWARITGAGKVEIREEFAAELPYVLADDGALQSIFTNLLSNAIRYTPAGGVVTVRASHEGSDVVVEVTDTGIGISAEDQLRIYERFYRTDDAKKVATFGIGLGLAITRDLVSSLTGTIEIQSEVGVGSTFRISLPAADSADDEDA